MLIRVGGLNRSFTVFLIFNPDFLLYFTLLRHKWFGFQSYNLLFRKEHGTKFPVYKFPVSVSGEGTRERTLLTLAYVHSPTPFPNLAPGPRVLSVTYIVLFYSSVHWFIALP